MKTALSIILIGLAICMGACCPTVAPAPAQPPSGSSSLAGSSPTSPAPVNPPGSSVPANPPSSSAPAVSDSVLSTAVSDIPTSVLLPNKTLLAYETHNLEWTSGEGEQAQMLAFSGVNFLIGTNPADNPEDLGSSQETPCLTFHSYNILTKKNVPLGTIHWADASVSSVLMKGRYYYVWYGDYDDNLNNLYKLDLLGESKMKAVETSNVYASLVDFSKLNDHEFLTATGSGDQYKDAYAITVKKYDSNTDIGKDLFSEIYSDTYPASGTSLGKICCHDGKIYGPALVYQGNHTECYLNIYNTDGLLEQSIPAPVFKSNFQYSGLMNLYVVGKYIVINNGNMDYAAYTIEGGQLSELIPATENIQVVDGSDDYSEYDHYAYIFYYHFSPNCEFIDNYIFALDAETGQTKRIDVQIDKDYPVMDTFQVDESGNMVITMRKNHLDQTAERHYYVKAEDIKALLGL